LRCLVFSDSHRDMSNMHKITKRFYPDVVLHLGDSIYDAIELEKSFPSIRFECVRGNIDEDSDAPDERLITLEKVNVYLTHVQKEDGIMLDKSINENAQIYLYGNTHTPAFSVSRGIILMNPGAIGADFEESSFGLIDIFESEYRCNIMFANHYH